MNNKENESFGLLFALEQIKTETGFKIERDKDKPNLFYLIEPNSSAPFAELDFNEEIKNAKNHNQRITLRECAEIFAGRIRRIIQERSRRSLGESERSEAESRESRAESRESRAESERSENISIAGASFGNASAGFTSLQDMIIYRKDIGNAEPKKYIDVLAVLLNDFKKDMDKHKSSQNSLLTYEIAGRPREIDENLDEAIPQEDREKIHAILCAIYRVHIENYVAFDDVKEFFLQNYEM